MVDYSQYSICPRTRSPLDSLPELKWFVRGKLDGAVNNPARISARTCWSFPLPSRGSMSHSSALRPTIFGAHVPGGSWGYSHSRQRSGYLSFFFHITSIGVILVLTSLWCQTCPDVKACVGARHVACSLEGRLHAPTGQARSWRRGWRRRSRQACGPSGTPAKSQHAADHSAGHGRAQRAPQASG